MPANLPKNESIVSISQAADVLGVSIDTLRRWDNDGTLKAQRPDGVTRYYSVRQLEEIKLLKPLTISEASKELGVSQSTLRRLDKQGIIRPERNKNGERLYTKKSLNAFLNSEYFIRKTLNAKAILQPLKSIREDKVPETLPSVEANKETLPQEEKQNRVLIMNAILADQQEKLSRVLAFRRFIQTLIVLGFILPGFVVVILTLSFIFYPVGTASFTGILPLTFTKSKVVEGVLGAATEEIPVSKFSAPVLRPFSAVSLAILHQISPATYYKVVPGNMIENVNEVLAFDEQGNLITNGSFKIASSAIKFSDNTAIENLNAQYLDSRRPGNEPGDLVVINSDGLIDGSLLDIAGISADQEFSSQENLLVITSDMIEDLAIVGVDIADGAITSIKIENNTISSEDIADGAITSAKISDGSINSGDIEDNTISANDLSGSLSFSNGDLLDLSAINHDVSGKRGLILPNTNSAPVNPISGEGYLAWDSDGDQILVYDGSSWGAVAGGGSGDITAVVAGDGLSGGATSGSASLSVLLTSSGTTGSTASSSGLEVDSDGLTLLKGCSDNELLKYTDAGGWACATDTSGGGSATIQEGDSTIVASLLTLDFLGADFTVSESPSNEANISIDYASSGIARVSQAETVTGGWTFNTAATTFTSSIIANGGISLANSESIGNGADGTITFGRNDAGVVTLTSADNDTTAALTILPGGASALTLGGGSTTAITLTTDSTGDAEVVLPGNSIGNSELVNSGITFVGNSGSGSIALGGTLTIAGAGINNAVYSGSTVTITGTEADTLNTVVGRGASTATALTLSSTSNEITVGTLTINSDAFTDLTGTGLTISGGALQTTLGVAIDTSEITDNTIANTDLADDTLDFTKISDSLTLDAATSVTAGSALGLTIGNNVTLSATGTGLITATDLLCTDCIGSTEISDLTLGTDTAGNYVATVTGGAGLTGSGSSEGSTPTLAVGAGDGIAVNADDIAVNLATSGTTGSTSSSSGLEVGSGGLTLLKGCSDNELLKYTDAGGWACASDSTGSSQTPWTANIDADGYDLVDLSNIEFRETTEAPAGTAVSLYRDNTGDLNANVLTGKTFNIQVNGSDEFNFSSSGLSLNSNNLLTGNTTLSATELDLLDSGVALSELTDSGTLTATTVDINGGAIDGTIIGANSAAAVTATTLTANTSISLGGDTIDEFVGTGLQVSSGDLQVILGTSIANSEIDDDTVTLAKISDSLTFDSDLTFISDNATNDYKLVVDNSSTGDVATGLSFTTSGTGASWGTAVDLSDADIVVGLALGANDVTVGGVTISSTEFARLDGKDAALVDTSDAVATAITGTGTLTAGATGAGFTINFGTSTLSGDITSANISGVDISADTNLSASNGVTLTGDALSLSSSSAGDGLTYTTGVIAVGSGAGISVTADSISATLGTSIANSEIDDDVVNFDKIANALTLDEATTITAGGALGLTIGNNVTLSTTGTGAITATDLSCADCITGTEIGDLTLGTDTAGNYVASVTGGAGLTGSGSTEGSTPTLAVGAGTGITVNADDIALDQSTAFTWSGVQSWTNTVTATGAQASFNLTLGDDSDTDTVSGVSINVTSAATSDADIVYGLNVGNLASANGTVLERAIRIGTGWDAAFDIEGTLLTSAEVSLLDGGITLSELTDSGTLTVTTVDINGGAIDGTAIGAASRSTALFTTLGANGNTVLGDANTDTLTINAGSSGSGITFADSSFANCTALETVSGVLTCGSDASGGSQTPWVADIDADGFDVSDLSNIEFRETTEAPEGTDVSLYRDNTGDLNTNVLTGKTFNIQVNGSDEYNFNSTGLSLNSNNLLTGNTTLSATELDLIDGGIALSELTDSGTLTATTVDINGGAIDGTIIGAASAAAGTFSTLTASTSVTLGGDTIDEFVGTGLQVSSGDLQVVLGTSIANSEVDDDTLTLAKVSDSLTLDADLTFVSDNATSDFKLVLDNSSTGDIATGLVLSTSGTGATWATAIDLSDADIATALALGANDITVGGSTISSTEFARLDGKDAALVDTSDAVATAITGVGTLTAGATGAGFTLNFGASTLSGSVTGANISGVDVSDDTNLTATDGITLTADQLTLASTTGGAGLTYTTGVLAVGAGTGITVNANDVALDQTAAFTWSGVQSWTNTVTATGAQADFNLTLGDDSDVDTISAVNIDVTSADTSEADIVYGLNVGNLASANATVLERAIRIGTGWDAAFDIEGTLLTSAEVTLLDSGVALSELTDSGTLTATTVDINGGAVDGTAIGAASRSTALFTSLGANGNTVLGDANSDTLTINAGVSGTGITFADGSFANCTALETVSGVLTCGSDASGGSQTPWVADIDADGFDVADLSNLEFRETTEASAGTVVALYSDNTGDLNANVLTGKTFNIQVNGSDEFNFSSTGLSLNSNSLLTGNTTLAAAELDLLDSGIALSELTDSGTLTATTVDINGGAIDGTAIGAASRSTALFTTLGANGNVTIGDANTDTLTINAGSSGTGITFADGSFANCTALETSSGVLTCGTDDSGGGSSLQAAYDGDANGSDAIILTNSTDGSVIIQTAAGTQFQVAASAAPTVDLASITNAGQGATSTSGIDGLSITYVQSTDAADITGSGLDITITPSTDAGDIIRALTLNNVTPGNSTETGLYVGTGYDRDLEFADSSPTIRTADGAVLSFSDGTNNLLAIKDQGAYAFLNIAAKSTGSDPANCAVGDVYINSSDATIKACTGTDTWEALDGGGGGGVKVVTLHPEFPGATLAANGSATINGTMTSDITGSADGWKNFYEWTSSQTSLQDYTIAVRFKLPSDFSSWATSNAIVVNFVTESTADTNNKIDIDIRNEDDTPGTTVNTSSANVSGVAATWTSVAIDDSSIDDGGAPDIDAAGEDGVLLLKLYSKDSNYARIGDIVFTYNAQ